MVLISGDLMVGIDGRIMYILMGIISKNYPLVICYSSLLNMAIEIVDLPIAW